MLGDVTLLDIYVLDVCNYYLCSHKQNTDVYMSEHSLRNRKAFPCRRLGDLLKLLNKLQSPYRTPLPRMYLKKIHLYGPSVYCSTDTITKKKKKAQ